jgi:hypothetical protein
VDDDNDDDSWMEPQTTTMRVTMTTAAIGIV